MYDRTTVSLLGPGCVFGLPSTSSLAAILQQAVPRSTSPSFGGGSPAPYGVSFQQDKDKEHSLPVVVETYSQVKVYCIRHTDLVRLPPEAQQVLLDANTYNWSYYDGRLEGLTRMEQKRRAAQRDAMLRKQVSAALGTRARKAGGPQSPLDDPVVSAALASAAADNSMLSKIPILLPSVANTTPATQAKLAAAVVAMNAPAVNNDLLPLQPTQAVDPAAASAAAARALRPLGADGFSSGYCPRFRGNAMLARVAATQVAQMLVGEQDLTAQQSSLGYSSGSAYANGFGTCPGASEQMPFGPDAAHTIAGGLSPRHRAGGRSSGGVGGGYKTSSGVQWLSEPNSPMGYLIP